ncbi:hypothetical protein AAHC03_09754 [Spirometra sp. Aus1]
MICLACRFNDLGGPACSISDIWDHLSELYDLNELNESEVIPFPTKSKEYTLPEEFSTLKQQAFPRAKTKLVLGSPSQQTRKTDSTTANEDLSPLSPSPPLKRTRKALRSGVPDEDEKSPSSMKKEEVTETNATSNSSPGTIMPPPSPMKRKSRRH